MDEVKHLNDIITEEDEKHIKARLDPIITDWMKKHNHTNVGHYKLREFLYELARNCYLTGMLVDGVMAQLEIEKENK